MLTVQACQQHRLAAMNPNKAKSFSAAIVPAVVNSHVLKQTYSLHSELGSNSLYLITLVWGLIIIVITSNL